MAEGQRFYWLKLKRDFFKRHDIRIIENMPNGKDYILFYLKLLCESIDHEGHLRFSERIPYSEDMLATITDTNVDIVRAAVSMFIQLGMMELMDDGTYFMCEVEKMIGFETEWALKKREYRQRLRQEKDNVLELSETKETESDKSKSKNKSKSKSIEKEKDSSSTAADELIAYAANNLQYLSPTHVEELASFRDSLTDDVIKWAIDEACGNGVRQYNYVKSILNRLVEENVKTVGEAKATNEKRRTNNGHTGTNVNQGIIGTGNRTADGGRYI